MNYPLLADEDLQALNQDSGFWLRLVSNTFTESWPDTLISVYPILPFLHNTVFSISETSPDATHSTSPKYPSINTLGGHPTRIMNLLSELEEHGCKIPSVDELALIFDDSDSPACASDTLWTLFKPQSVLLLFRMDHADAALRYAFKTIPQDTPEQLMQMIQGEAPFFSNLDLNPCPTVEVLTIETFLDAHLDSYSQFDYSPFEAHADFWRLLSTYLVFTSVKRVKIRILIEGKLTIPDELVSRHQHFNLTHELNDPLNYLIWSIEQFAPYVMGLCPTIQALGVVIKEKHLVFKGWRVSQTGLETTHMVC